MRQLLTSLNMITLAIFYLRLTLHLFLLDSDATTLDASKMEHVLSLPPPRLYTSPVTGCLDKFFNEAGNVVSTPNARYSQLNHFLWLPLH